MDECRLGLLPIHRRVWALKGTRPRVDVYPRYQWLYVYAAIEPTRGRTFSMIWSTVNLEAMQYWLNEFSRALDADEHALLVMDGAGWHSETGLKWPENVSPLWIPPYSPECNPSERLWTILKESIANKVYHDIGHLEAAVGASLRSWQNRTSELSKLTSFGWWRDAVNSEQS